jgi:hypothetical protein
LLRRRLIPLAVTFGLGLGALPLACGSDTVKSPFGPGAGGAAGAGGEQGSAGFRLDIDAGDVDDPTLGGPCQDDGQCDDEVDCTFDSCDASLGRCRFRPDDSSCNDRIYCDGPLRCDVRAGCVPGEPVSCSDDSTCTIDACVEATQSCRHDPRDADGDGDPTRNCGGQDCDDDDPLSSSDASEVCGNRKDDDCDGATDENDCTAPEHDDCDDPLQIVEDGFYDIDLTATALDFPSSCAQEKDGYRDAVVTIVVPEGEPVDVDVTAKLDSGSLVLGTANSCGAVTGVACQPSFESPAGASVNRLILRGKTAGEYPVYVQADGEGMVQLRVEQRPAEAHAPELCEQALELVPNGDRVLLRLPAYRKDFRSDCAPPPEGEKLEPPPVSGDAFLTFTLDEARDITLIAEAELELGVPMLALVDESCRRELTCRRSQPGRLFERNLPAGTYRVAVAATAPDDVSVRLETAPVSQAPPAEGCAASPPLVPGIEQLVDLSQHEDAVSPRCQVGSPDATFALQLDSRRDVGLFGRFSDGDRGAVSIAKLDCGASLACEAQGSIGLAVYYGLSAGEYRAIIESARGNPVGLTWFDRPPAPAVYVPFSDDCAGAIAVPEEGGHFSGSTANAFADFSAGCDVGGQPEGGAPDQILRLRLEQARRVLLDLRGDYEPILSVREGEFCPGAEIACFPGYQANRGILDLDLAAGDYFIQIDGFDGASGSWNLEVFTALLDQ